MSSLPAPRGSSVFHRREFGPSQPYSREFLSPNYKCVPPLIPSVAEGDFPVAKLKYPIGMMGLGAGMNLIALRGLPIVKKGDDIAQLIAHAANGQVKIENGDIIVVAQSIVSKAEGNVYDLREINPSPRAIEIGKKMGRDPRKIELILRESTEIVRQAHVLITRTKHGFVCANAGVDSSNVDEDHATTLPEDPDASARRIRERIKDILGVDVAVIISDTHGRPFRKGAAGVAIGVAGMEPLWDLRDKRDLYGKKLTSTIFAAADSFAAAATIVMGETNEGTPVVIIKGAKYKPGDGRATDLVRPREHDLFL